MLEAVEHALREGNGTCRIDVIGQGSHGYSTRFMCQRCARTFEPVRPIMFSFNHPIGACPQGKGFGNILRYDEELVVPNRNASLAEGAIEPWMKPDTDWWHKQMLLAMKRRKISVTTPYPNSAKPNEPCSGRGIAPSRESINSSRISNTNGTNCMCEFFSAGIAVRSHVHRATARDSNLRRWRSKSTDAIFMRRRYGRSRSSRSGCLRFT